MSLAVIRLFLGQRKDAPNDRLFLKTRGWSLENMSKTERLTLHLLSPLKTELFKKPGGVGLQVTGNLKYYVKLPAEMSKCFICFRHSVSVLTFLYR